MTETNLIQDEVIKLDIKQIMDLIHIDILSF